ncbi:MAG TPA: chalcone isomerase family protein [Burkholderiaceae bacterium]|nr:chalcone isomerase family protein [Burkholderiaceae bacterium]
MTARSAALAAALCAAWLAAFPAGPARADAPAPGPVAASFAQARLAGEGELRWYGLRVYTAQLWVPDPTVRFDALARGPFALELRYATGLRGEAIAERSVQEIERLGFGDPSRRARWLGEMKRLFPDVARGDRIAGIHEPGRGARFYVNDRPVGRVDDPDFAAAFFAIWLDERTVAPALRESLLRRLGGGSPR